MDRLLPMPRLLLVICLLAALLIAGCTEEPRVTQRRLHAMGTWVDITVIAQESSARTALDAAETLLRQFEVDYYAWAEGGELWRLNEALAAGRGAEVSAELAELLAEAQRLTRQTGGAFDPGIGGLVELWGFHSALEAPDAAPPPHAKIETWLRSGASLAAARIEGRRIEAEAPRLKIDLGGIAKGEAVDRLLALLTRHGIRDAMVNAGGDLRVLGTRGGRAWRIGIQHPRGDGVLGVIELENGQAAFTSGDYERYVEREGDRLHHILDPRTGRPAQDTRSVTVVASNGAWADAVATALFVAGEDWASLARVIGAEAVLRVDAAGRVELTRAMSELMSRDGPEQRGAESWNVIAGS